MHPHRPGPPPIPPLRGPGVSGPGGRLSPPGAGVGPSYPGSIHPGSIHPGSIHPGSIHPGSIHPGSIHPGPSDPRAYHAGAQHSGAPAPAPSTEYAALARRVPPLPAILGVLFVISLIGVLAGGGGGSVKAAGVGGQTAESRVTTKSTLCASYSALQTAMFDPDQVMDVGPKIAGLAAAAKDYPDAGVKADGRKLAKLGNNTIYAENLGQRMSNIRAECR